MAVTKPSNFGEQRRNERTVLPLAEPRSNWRSEGR